MKYFRIKHKSDVEFYLSYPARLVMPDEKVFIDFHSDILGDPSKDQVLNKILEEGNNVFHVWDWEERMDFVRIREFEQLGGKGILLKINLEKETDENDIHIRDHDFWVKSRICRVFRAYLDIFHKEFKMKVTPLLVLDSNNIEELFPTIVNMQQLEIEDIALWPGNLNIKEHHKKVADQLNMAYTYSSFDKFVYFMPEHSHSANWEASVLNPFRGPSRVDIDISNVCSHNCIFCGLYADEAKEVVTENNKENPDSLKNIFKTQIKTEDAFRVINELPDTTHMVSFGGAGEPFSHPKIYDMIERCRNRGFKVYCFSHFAYMDEGMLDKLNNLSLDLPNDIHFIVNLSAANAETYTRIRPNQGKKVFDKVINSLKYLKKIRTVYNKGPSVTLMSVTNSENYKDMIDLVALAVDVGAYDLWFKPMEIHGKNTVPYLIKEETELDYLITLRLALYFAKKLNLRLLNTEPYLKHLEQRKELLAEYDKENPFTSQVKAIIKQNELLANYLFDPEAVVKSRIPDRNADYIFRHEDHDYDYEKKMAAEVYTELSFDEGSEKLISNAGVPANFYDNNACYVGYEYIRYDVNGDLLPCCISRYTITPKPGRDFKEIWSSHPLASFREKMKKINTEKFHRNDPEWLFCQQCSHLDINERFRVYRKDT